MDLGNRSTWPSHGGHNFHLFSDADKVIEERKKALKDGLVLEEIQKKRHLDFLDILLCAKVSVTSTHVTYESRER